MTVVNIPIWRRIGTGLLNSEGEAISRSVFQAPAMVGERKKIQASTVRANVNSIRNAIVGTLTNRLAELAALARGSPINTRGMTYRPLSTPQTMNVQLAPCHRPLKVKVIKRLTA